MIFKHFILRIIIAFGIWLGISYYFRYPLTNQLARFWPLKKGQDFTWKDTWKSQCVEENTQLRKALRFVHKSSFRIVLSTHLLWAPITGRSWWIHGGSKNGLKEGLWVINRHGLVGRIGIVQTHSAEIIPVTSINYRVPVVITSDNSHAIASGTNNDTGILLYFRNIPSTLQNNSPIVTSGHGPFAIPGIPVGTLILKNNKPCIAFAIQNHPLGFVHIIEQYQNNIS